MWMRYVVIGLLVVVGVPGCVSGGADRGGDGDVPGVVKGNGVVVGDPPPLPLMFRFAVRDGYEAWHGAERRSLAYLVSAVVFVEWEGNVLRFRADPFITSLVDQAEKRPRPAALKDRWILGDHPFDAYTEIEITQMGEPFMLALARRQVEANPALAGCTRECRSYQGRMRFFQRGEGKDVYVGNLLFSLTITADGFMRYERVDGDYFGPEGTVQGWIGEDGRLEGWEWFDPGMPPERGEGGDGVREVPRRRLGEEI